MHVRSFPPLADSIGQNITGLVGTGTGTEIQIDGRKAFSIQLAGVGGAPTSWTLDLQVSNDKVNWTSVVNHVTATGNGVVKAHTAEVPARWARYNLSALVLGPATNVTVSWVAAR